MKKDSDFTVILLMCLMAASSVGLSTNCTGVFFTPVSIALGIKRGTLALYATISSITTGLATMVIPRILTEKNFKKVLISGMMCNILAIFCMSFCNRIWQFYLLAILMGAGNSCFSMVIITIILNSLIHENLGTKTGLVLSFSGLGGAVFNPVLASVIEKHGWQSGYRIMAMIMLLLCLPSMVYPIRYIAAHKTDRKKRQSLIDGFMFRIFLTVILLQMIPALGQHMIGIGTDKGLVSSHAAYLTSACMIANVSFKLLAGSLSDHLGTIKTIAIIAIVNVMGDLLLLFGSSMIMLLLGAFLYGSVYAISGLLISLMCKDLYGSDQYREAYPVISFVSTITYALSVSMVGYMFDFTGSYGLPLTVATVFMILSSLMMAALYRTKRL